jgi:glutamate-ammonia-ligase adenylyltransferase
MNASAPGNAERHSLAARLIAGPYVSAPDKAEQRLGDWLREIEPAQSAALDALLEHANAKILLGSQSSLPLSVRSGPG